MSASERYQRAMDLFEQAMDCDPEQVDSFLDRASGDEASLRSEVASLLAHHHAAERDDFELQIHSTRERLLGLEQRATGPGQAVPSQLGNYRVLRFVGAGGMGLVYECEQEQPRRRVAVKLLAPGARSPAAMARFEQEAQVLAHLRHPSIAQVYEAGVLDVGLGDQPFLAMEFVEGLPLRAHAEKLRLDERARLGLVADIALAVQHAHDHGVIHRDLKPDNILVAVDGHPWLIDFGVARLLDASGLTSAAHTLSGELVGTLAYMSPEQVTGGDRALTPATDVYSLGVVAYELLTGQLPHDVDRVSLATASRLIALVPPRRPRDIDPSLPAGVEAILLCALRKEPARRYASPAALADDIGRFLAGQPLSARPPGPLTVVSAFARRHRSLVIATLSVVLVLGAATAVSLRLALSESRQRRVAELAGYRSSLTAASLALADHDPRLARSQLDRAPDELRGWEWHLLSAGFGRSSVRLWDVASARQLARLSSLGEVWGLMLQGEQWRLRLERDRIATWDPEEGLVMSTVGARPADQHAFYGPHPGRRVSYDQAWSPSGESLLSVASGKVRRYDGQSSWKEYRENTDPCSRALGVAWSPDGRLAASTHQDGKVFLFDPERMATVAVLMGHQGEALFADFHPDGTRLASGGRDGTVRIWDTLRFKELLVLKAHDNYVRMLSFSPDGRRLASASGDRTIHLWDAGRPAPAPAQKWASAPGHPTKNHPVVRRAPPQNPHATSRAIGGGELRAASAAKRGPASGVPPC